MKWTLITILSKNLKFDRHLNKAICVSAYRRMTNLFCRGKRFLNIKGGEGGGGRDGDVIQESNYPFFKWRHCQRTLLVWKDFISNIYLGQTNSFNLNKFRIGNNVPNCLSAPFTYSHIVMGLLVLAKARFLCIVHKNTTASNDQ